MARRMQLAPQSSRRVAKASLLLYWEYHWRPWVLIPRIWKGCPYWSTRLVPLTDSFPWSDTGVEPAASARKAPPSKNPCPKPRHNAKASIPANNLRYRFFISRSAPVLLISYFPLCHFIQLLFIEMKNFVIILIITK